MQLIKMVQFYSKLVDLGLKMKLVDHKNLSTFLSIDGHYPDLFLVKKLIRAIEAFENCSLFQSMPSKVSQISYLFFDINPPYRKTN